jgi:hypothetical protein
MLLIAVLMISGFRSAGSQCERPTVLHRRRTLQAAPRRGGCVAGDACLCPVDRRQILVNSFVHQDAYYYGVWTSPLLTGMIDVVLLPRQSFARSRCEPGHTAGCVRHHRVQNRGYVRLANGQAVLRMTPGSPLRLSEHRGFMNPLAVCI